MKLEEALEYTIDIVKMHHDNGFDAPVGVDILKMYKFERDNVDHCTSICEVEFPDVVENKRLITVDVFKSNVEYENCNILWNIDYANQAMIAYFVKSIDNSKEVIYDKYADIRKNGV